MKCPAVLRLRFVIALVPLLLAGAAFAQEKSKTKITVLPLKYTVAADVAPMLEIILGDDFNPATTRIIPEPRTNTLFVTGPDEATKTIGELLRILDVDAIPKGGNELKVFNLQNSDAASTQKVATTLIGPGVQIVADERTNTLIAQGKKDELMELEALLLKLDESNGRSQRLHVVEYELKHISAQEAADNLTTLGAEAKVAVDKTGNRLLVACDAARHEVVKNILQMLDVAEKTEVLRPMQLRLVWLVEEKLAGENAAAPAANLEKPLKVLEERLGLTNLKTAAQFVVSLEPDADAQSGGRHFTARGTAEFKDEMFTNLEFQGFLKGESAGRPVIEVYIRATATQTVVKSSRIPPNGLAPGPSSSRSTNELAGVETKVAAPLGHSVVLGVTSIRSAASVFILQVLPADGD